MPPKRQILSASEKLMLIRRFEGGECIEHLSRESGIPKSSLYKIVTSKEKIESKCSDGQGKCKRARLPCFPELERCLVAWIKECRSRNIPVNGPLIKEKGRQFALEQNIDNFKASNGWFDGFKKRNDLTLREVQCSESENVDQSVCSQWISDMLSLINDYTADNIFNVVETGLFYRCLPTHTSLFKGQQCHGGKLSNERATLLLCANMSGSEKLPLLMIGKFKKPKCFAGVKTLPVEYRSNKNAWMTRDLFHNWLKSIEKSMKFQKRKIILFMDNCSAHTNIPNLEFVQIMFLPANTTNKLQPLHLGIINNFKVLYRNRVVRHTLDCMESQPNISILQAMRFARIAWHDVKPNTIQNCFRKAGFMIETDTSSFDSSSGAISDAEWTTALNLPSSLTAQLQLPTFDDYVRVDDDLETAGLCTDHDDDDSGEDDSHEEPHVTKKDARHALQTLQKFFEATSCDREIFDRIGELRTTMEATSTIRQTVITDFFCSNLSTSTKSLTEF